MSTNSCCRGLSVQNRVQDHPQENSDSKKPFFPFFDFFVVVIAASHSVPPHLHGGSLCPFGTVLFLRQLRHWYTPAAVAFSPVLGIIAPVRTCLEVPGASLPFADSSSSESRADCRSSGFRPSNGARRGRCDASSSRTSRHSDLSKSRRVWSLAECTVCASGPANKEKG